MARTGGAITIVAALLFLTACASANEGIRVGQSDGLIYKVTAHGGIAVNPIAQPAGRGTMILDGGDFEALGDLIVANAGPKPILCLIDTAASGQGTPYRKFDRYDGIRMFVFNITAKTSAAPRVIEALEQCTGYYFSGGKVQLLSQGFLDGQGDSRALAIIRRRFEHAGAVVAGTSAGAMTQGPITLCEWGTERNLNAQTATLPCLNPGFGFVDKVLIDVHFFARGLIGRNLNALAKISAPVSVGIDQKTAVVVPGNGGLWQVVGKSSVAIIRREPVATAGASTKFTISLLNAGDRFDPQSGRVATAPTRKPQSVIGDSAAGPLRMGGIFEPDRLRQLIVAFARGRKATAQGDGEAEGMVIGLRKRSDTAVFVDAHSTSVLNLDIDISQL